MNTLLHILNRRLDKIKLACALFLLFGKTSNFLRQILYCFFKFLKLAVVAENIGYIVFLASAGNGAERINYIAFKRNNLKTVSGGFSKRHGSIEIIYNNRISEKSSYYSVVFAVVFHQIRRNSEYAVRLKRAIEPRIEISGFYGSHGKKSNSSVFHFFKIVDYEFCGVFVARNYVLHRLSQSRFDCRLEFGVHTDKLSDDTLYFGI